MIDLNNSEYSFRTEAEVNAYARFFLDSNPLDMDREFLNQEEENDFHIRRERNLKAQLDHFKNINFTGANKGKVEANYFKIVETQYPNPLSSIGSQKKSSRFNYKNVPLLRNRAIYFGRNKLCCEIELFHLEHHRDILRQTYDPKFESNKDDIKYPKHTLYEYQISLDNVLILTTKPSLDAIGITASTFMNEWFDVNDMYEIPTASQFLGTIARIQGYKGILYKSVRYQLESNLVIFEENAGELQFEKINYSDYNPSEELMKPLI